MNDRPYTLL